MESIKLEQHGRAVHIVIDNEDKRNALTQTMWTRLSGYLDDIEYKIKPRVVILRATGDRAFCSGADIEELATIIQNRVRLTENNLVIEEVQQKLHKLSCATIAAINGACVGAGLGLALACDFRVAVDDASFGVTPAKLGLLYSIEDTRRLVSVVGVARAREMLFLGEVIDAKRAQQWGLVTALCSAPSLQGRVDELAERLMASSGNSIAGLKRTLDFIRDKDGWEAEIQSLFDAAFTHPDFEEGASAFLDKRPPRFT